MTDVVQKALENFDVCIYRNGTHEQLNDPLAALIRASTEYGCGACGRGQHQHAPDCALIALCKAIGFVIEDGHLKAQAGQAA